MKRYCILLLVALWAPAALAAPAGLGMPPGMQDRMAPWSYDGLNDSQENWAGLAPSYAVCDLGTAQSPIDITYTKREKLPMLKISYHLSKAHIRPRDYTLVTAIKDEDTLSENGHSYRLMQLRMHMPGEHHVREQWWPMELQFIHRDAQDKLLILSVLVQYGQSNPAIQAIIDQALRPAAESEIDLSQLLPQQRGYYAYTGSLTSPPCTEGVEWRVFKQPITFSKEQAEALTQFMGRNARLPQPVYMRTVKESVE